MRADPTNFYGINLAEYFSSSFIENFPLAGDDFLARYGLCYRRLIPPRGFSEAKKCLGKRL